jgi:hypothetical protein
MPYPYDIEVPEGVIRAHEQAERLGYPDKTRLIPFHRPPHQATGKGGGPGTRPLEPTTTQCGSATISQEDVQ